MTKLLFAMFSTMFVLALATGASSTAAPATTQPDDEIGACRYFCGGDPTAFKTRPECQATCSTLCDAVC